MQKLFWSNPYQCNLITCVSSVENNRLLFNETIAFSFSGGQESDTAFVNGMKILNSEIEENLIYYTLPEGHNLSTGDTITMEIDWTRRYRLMRLHFAAELILELITKTVAIEKIGAHIAETKARIDFLYDKNISVYFENVLTEYNKIIAEDMPIKTGFSDILTQRRYWEIEGLSKVACGGTHVKSTGEVGYITLKRINLGSGKERIEIRLDAA
jgi:Ser-tRNA(Ala) deacylase AlaX